MDKDNQNEPKSEYQHLADVGVSEPKTGITYRIRNKDFLALDGRVREIQDESSAMVATFSTDESSRVGHSFICLGGTAEQISTAKEYILSIIVKERYSGSVVPVILKPRSSIQWEKIKMPSHKFGSFFGADDGSNIVELEKETDTWIEIEGGPHLDTCVLCVSGSADNILEALLSIQSAIRQVYDSSEVDQKISKLRQKKAERYAKAKIEEQTICMPATAPSSSEFIYKLILGNKIKYL